MKTIFSAKIKHRQATWLELFFDLVFVAVIDLITDELAHLKNGVVSMSQIFHFIFSFIPLWWIWATHTLFANRFDNSSTFYKTHTLLIMAMLIFISSSSSHSISKDFNFFVPMYCAIRVLLATGYYFIYRSRADYKAFTGKKTVYILIGATISGSSLFFQDEITRMIIFFIGIIYELISHALVCHRYIAFPVHKKHLVERVGILTVIIMGQTIVSILSGIIHHKELTTNAIIASFAGFVFISALWLVYFSSINWFEKAKFMKTGIALIYSHLIFYIGLIILACLVRHAIMQDIPQKTFLLFAMVGMPLFYFGRQIAYFVYYPHYKIYLPLIASSLVGIGITFLSALFDNIAYALSGMACGMIVYLILIKIWVIPIAIQFTHKYTS